MNWWEWTLAIVAWWMSVGVAMYAVCFFDWLAGGSRKHPESWRSIARGFLSVPAWPIMLIVYRHWYQRIEHDHALKLVRHWKWHWQHHEDGYQARAFGIDSNMVHDLARRLSK